MFQFFKFNSVQTDVTRGFSYFTSASRDADNTSPINRVGVSLYLGYFDTRIV